MLQQSHSWAYIQQNYNSKRYIYCYAHSCIIPNSQETETTEKLITRWVVKDVVHTYNEVLLSLKKTKMK